jgi:elongation of very long chain fatty acids protein 4
MFYYQKFYEFVDTFIFMMRNSYRQVTFLHVYHHSSITIVVAMYVVVVPSLEAVLGRGVMEVLACCDARVHPSIPLGDLVSTSY